MNNSRMRVIAAAVAVTSVLVFTQLYSIAGQTSDQASSLSAEIVRLDSQIAAAALHKDRNYDGNRIYSNLRSNIIALRWAAEKLLGSSGVPPIAPKTLGEEALFITRITNEDTFRPGFWEKTYVSSMESKSVSLRGLAVYGWYVRMTWPIPLRPPVSIQNALQPMLQDSDRNVRILAFELAKELRNKEYKDSALKSVEQATDYNMLHASLELATACGARFEAMEILSGKICESPYALNLLLDACITGSCGGQGVIGGSETEKTSVQSAWLSFLKKHESALRNGKTFQLGDPRLPIALCPDRYFLFDHNGKQWPDHLALVENRLDAPFASKDLRTCQARAKSALAELQQQVVENDFRRSLVGMGPAISLRNAARENAILIKALNPLVSAYKAAGNENKASNLQRVIKQTSSAMNALRQDFKLQL